MYKDLVCFMHIELVTPVLVSELQVALSFFTRHVCIAL